MQEMNEFTHFDDKGNVHQVAPTLETFGDKKVYSRSKK